MTNQKLKVCLAGLVLLISFLSLPNGVRDAGATLASAWPYALAAATFLFDSLRWLYLALSLILIWFFIRLYKLRNIPLRIVESDFCLEFKADWSRTKMARTQWVLANRPQVEAIRTDMKPNNGAIEKDSMALRMLYRGESIDQPIKLFGNPRSGWKIFHITKIAFPYTFGSELIPASILAFWKDSLFGKKFLVRREFESWHIDEYNVEDPSLELNSVNYSSHNIKIRLVFRDCEPPPEVKAFIIRSNGVDEESFEKVADGGVVFEYKQRKLPKGDSLLITWPNPNYQKLSASHGAKWT